MARTVTPKVAALIERGMQAMRSGDFQEAARAFERASQQMPELAEVHAMRADALMRAGKLGPALGSAERALRLRPGWGEVLMLRGNIEALLGRPAVAEKSFRQALQALGPSPALQANLGHVLFEQERFEEALAAYDQALAGRETLELVAGRAKALYALGRRADTEAAWKRVLELDPNSLEALEQLMQLYMGDRRVDELEAVAARGTRLDPDGAVFRIGQGAALALRGRHDESLALFREAARIAKGRDERLHYEAVLCEAMGLLKLGRWAEAWPRYRWRLDREALRARYPRLAAEPEEIAAATSPLRIRLHLEQGLGDELFFLRFAPLLRARGHRLSYRTQEKLVQLLQDRADLFDSIGRDDQEDPQPCDVELQTTDLPLASGASLAPPLALAPDEERRRVFAARLREFGPPPYVGVTWRAGAVPEEQKRFVQSGTPVWVKRVPIEAFGALLRPLRATVVVLTRKPVADEYAAFAAALGRPHFDASGSNDDLRDALALLSLLDEYVGVSNTNMHLLAGLPQRRARVLVNFPPEWRWGREGDESLWFPGFSLYRQSADRSWDEPLARLRADLVARPG